MDLTLVPILLLAAASTIPPTHIHAALTGRPHYEHSLLLCLGMQAPLSPTTLNEGEYPAVAAMTTGYVFRVENQATVMYLQRMGKTGHLVTLDVSPTTNQSTTAWILPVFLLLVPVLIGLLVGPVGFFLLIIGFVLFPAHVLSSVNFCIPLFLLAYGLIAVPADRFLIITVLLLVLSRLLSIISLRAKCTPSWHGAAEPGVKGDLLILLSQDRWMRIKGLVDDLKAVTSGSWLQAPRYAMLTQVVESVARLLVYLAVATLANAADRGKIVLLAGVFSSHILLALSNMRTKELIMNGRKIKVSEQDGSTKRYRRRLDLAEELVAESKRTDWAIRLGMINPTELEEARGSRTTPGEEAVTM